MSLQKALVHLRSENVEFLRLFFREYAYNAEHVLFYKEQVPTLAFLLTEGFIHLKKNRNTLEVPQHSIIGVRELFSKQPAKFQAKIMPGAKVLGLDLYTFHQFLSENPQYHDIFSL